MTTITNMEETHDEAGYPIDAVSGTEIAYLRSEPRMKGVTEDVYNIEVNAEEVKSEAKERKDTPVYSGVLKYFPNSIKYISKVSKVGNDQHHPDKPLHWDMTKSKDEEDALVRHLIDHSVNPIDTDGMLHLGKVAWRALAALERHLTDNK